GRGFLLLDLTNPGPDPLNLGIRIDDDPSADGRLHCRTAQVPLAPRESATVAVALASADPMAHGMPGPPAYPHARAVRATPHAPPRWSHIFAFQVFLHRPGTERSVEIRAARLAPSISLDGIVDALGQYAGADWPGKVHSESELAQRHEQEARD